MASSSLCSWARPNPKAPCAVKRAICRAHDSRFGARDLSRRLRTRLEPALAEALLRDPGERVWRAVLQDGAIRVEPLASD